MTDDADQRETWRWSFAGSGSGSGSGSDSPSYLWDDPEIGSETRSWDCPDTGLEASDPGTYGVSGTITDGESCTYFYDLTTEEDRWREGWRAG